MYLHKGIKGAYDDGFYQRMLFIAPEPSDLSASDIRNAPKPIITSTVIIYCIQQINQTARQYKYTTKAAEKIMNEFNRFIKYVRLANLFDLFYR